MTANKPSTKRQKGKENNLFKYRRWKPEEDKLLIKLYDKKTLKELAILFNRKPNKVCRRAMRLGIKKDSKIYGKTISMILKDKFKKGEISRAGNKNSRWNGGIVKKTSGYIYKWTEDGGYIALHRLKIEKKIGRKLTEKEVVHHLDHNPSNNRIENLALCKNESEHKIKYHLKECMENIAKTPSHRKKYDSKNTTK